jgi:hypothetical protein
LKDIQYVDVGGGSNLNGLLWDGNGGNLTGVWGWIWVGLVASQSTSGNALLIPSNSALKRSGAGSPSEYGEVEVGQCKDGDGALDQVNSCLDTLETICK